MPIQEIPLGQSLTRGECYTFKATVPDPTPVGAVVNMYIGATFATAYFIGQVPGTGGDYTFNFDFPLVTGGRDAFVKADESLVGHGGIAIEEVIVPLVKFERKTTK